MMLGRYFLSIGTLLGAILLLLPAAPSSAACPPDKCRPYGECVMQERGCGDNCEERCVCDKGYAGRDCSFSVNLCEHGENDSGIRACFNGGVCYSDITNEYGGKEWKCDCSRSFGDSGNFAGSQCEFPREIESCEIGKQSSDYAFCVNGGTCGDNMVESGEFFHGCTCSHLFEGRHCQFPAGTAPKREMILYPNSSTKGMGPGAVAVVVLLALAATIAFAVWIVVIRRRRQARSWARPAVNTTTSYTDYEDGELQLEEVDMNDDAPPASLSPTRAGVAGKELI